jgi:hypothetical protein
LVYVDDLLIAAKPLSAVEKVKSLVSAVFDAWDLGEARYFVGFGIIRDRDGSWYSRNWRRS